MNPAASRSTGLEDVADAKDPSVIRSGNRQDIILAVHSAWAATLPWAPIEIEKSWSDIGVDSLKALEFILRLERSLGIRVSFDAMTPDSTASDLIRLLADDHAAHPRPEPQQRLFLIPGILGDEPKLATFRRALSKEVAFEILELPEIDASIKVLRSVAATAAVLVNRISVMQPEGDILLVGFSFGGLVAQDVSRQLEATGRTVRFLVVFDGPLGPTAPQRSLSTNVLSAVTDDIAAIRSAIRRGRVPAQSKSRTRAEFRASFDRPIFAVLMRLGAWGLARRVLLGAASRHNSIWLNRRRRRFLFSVRGWAMLRWRPKASNTTTLLFTSEDKYASIEAWQSICPRLRVTTLQADHGQMFEPGTLAVVRRAFLEHLADASDQAAA